MVNQSGAFYWYQCGDLGCDNEYTGETSRTFGERYKEHLKAPSAIHHHSSQTGHPTSHNNFQIIGREGHNLARNIKESIYIRVNNPTLNNNIGKFNLPHMWDRVLLNTKGLFSPFTLPGMHLSMLSRHFRLHISACIPVPFQT